jgi:tRNA nucleotidyltransferase (CCA-adding enzyme)
VEEIEGQTHKNNFYHTLEVVECVIQKMMFEVALGQTKRPTKQGWTLSYVFLGGKMVKK